jgi:predicted RNase H-like nuclease (RuvC/YqgF family)
MYIVSHSDNIQLFPLQVTNLRREREATIARQLSDVSHDTQKVRQLQRDNAQLNMKVKGLLSELEEIRAQREHLGMQSDHVSRIQTKQLTEHASNIRALQVNLFLVFEVAPVFKPTTHRESVQLLAITGPFS